MEDRKRIKFSDDGVDYTLEYTPNSVRKMERDGFDFTAMDKNVVNVGYDLFRGAFISRHNYVPVQERDKMYEKLMSKNEAGEDLLECLANMLKDELDWIVSKPQGNVSWAMV